LAHDDVLARLKRLANELDAAKTSTELTAKRVRHAKKITEKVKKDVRLLDTSTKKRIRRHQASKKR
jgi:hypothetical protein